MIKQLKPIRVALTVALLLCLAAPGVAEQSRPAQATTRARDDAAARAKSAENLKRIASHALAFASENEEIRVPRTLRELQADDWRVPPEVFMNPRIGSKLPEKIGDTPEAQAQWVEKNSDYVWGGAGRRVRELYPDTLLAWEKPDTVKEGIHIAFADATVRFVKFPEANEMIQRGRASVEQD